MTQYLYDVYSNKGIETVLCETLYKPEWQVRQELEENYKRIKSVKGSVIVSLQKIIK